MTEYKHKAGYYRLKVVDKLLKYIFCINVFQKIFSMKC
jgi:hypothetical protein